MHFASPRGALGVMKWLNSCLRYQGKPQEAGTVRHEAHYLLLAVYG